MKYQQLASPAAKGIQPYKDHSHNSSYKNDSSDELQPPAIDDFMKNHTQQSLQNQFQQKAQQDEKNRQYIDKILQERALQQEKQTQKVTVLSQDQTSQPLKVNSQNSMPNDPQMSQKMDLYYRSNPLNAIPENWELESKTSGMYESQSQKKVSLSKVFESKLSSAGNSENILNVKDLQMNLSPHASTNSEQKFGTAKDSQKSGTFNKSENKKEKVEAIKTRLKQLFLNYCDYSLDNGNIYITYTNLIKIIRDAQIYDETLNQNMVSIIISKECNSNSNIIKHISFDQFLNTILRISELKFPDKFRKYPKSALQSLLKNHILPLLKRIEQAVENHSDEFQYSLFTVSELTLKLIVYNEDTQVIFGDISPIIKLVYQKYFDQECSHIKSRIEENQKLSLRSVMQFVRDFELCPYLVHQKACFLIWYSVSHSKDIHEMTNNPDLQHIIPQSQNLGKSFTLGHFIIFLYRLGVIYFNHSQDNPQDFNLIKKLLYFLRKLENSDGIKKFMSKLNRTYNDSLTFLPSKELLSQILKAEGINDFGQNPEEYHQSSKDAMISRIIDNHLFFNKKGEVKNQDQSYFEEDEIEQFLLQQEDNLKKIFEIYCSFGDPMNTKYLKSSKLMKMLKECGLIKLQSRFPSTVKDANQLSNVEIDLAFKSIAARSENQRAFDQSQQSCMSSMMQSRDYHNNSSIQNHQASGFLKYQSQMMKSVMKKSIIHNQSQSLHQTSSFDNKSYLLNKNGANSGRLDFFQFKQVLDLLATKIYPQHTSLRNQAFSELLKHILLPQLKHVSDKRCIHNNKISRLLMLLDNQDMINLLTLLHKAIIELYRIYADAKGFMNFQQYINFCTDYEIFPVTSTKATLYRIFHSLSFMNDIMASQQKPQTKSQMSSMMPNSPSKQGYQPSHELIDEHLFVESLALIALFQDSDDDKDAASSDDIDEQNAFTQSAAQQQEDEDLDEVTPIEKVLHLIERMSNSEGVHRKQKKGQDQSNSIKCNLMEKKDLLDIFRNKYQWYFRNRYQENAVLKKKNFQDIMEMSSMLSDGSQLDM